jgi:murein DD-endopeptidase MepM/ murein hydrolase activator NlpD
MRSVVMSANRRRLSRLAVVGVLTAAFTGCSADTSRFNSPNANPFASRNSAPAEYTGSVQPAPTSQISSQPLPPPPNASRPTTVASSGVSGGGTGFGSYTPAPGPAPLAAPAPVAMLTPAPPPPPAHDVTGSIARPHSPSVAAAPAAPTGNVHVVAPGETLMSISRRYHKPLKQIADANHIPPHTHLKIGDRIVIPGRVVASAAPAVPAAPAAHAPAPAPVVAAPKAQPSRAIAAAPLPAPAPAPAPKVTAEASPSANFAQAGGQATAEAKATTGAAATAFKWPLRGRVISGFPKNDGIDLAVPEGTAVHAADDGVVAYAGAELKGYGNLILIRHQNGFVTAYAHASELMVKRNDTVRRGQVIAKSGQTGSVSAPQLHFEIRKGSTPVDPMQYLPSS